MAMERMAVGGTGTAGHGSVRVGAKKGGITVSSSRYPRPRRDLEAVWKPREGHVVKEPYAWLEDPSSEETAEFVTLQNELTNAVLRDDCPGRSSYKELLTKLMDYPKTTAPRRRGDSYFFYHNTGLQAQNVLYAISARDPIDESMMDETAKVVLDPNALSSDGTVALSSAAFTEDGSKLAYALSSGGSDWVEVRVASLDAEGNRTDLEDHLKWVKFSSLAWTRDNKGFFYNRYPEPDIDLSKAGTETDANTNQQLCYHTLGTDQSEDVLVWQAEGEGELSEHMMGCELTDCGLWLVAYTRFGCDAKNKLSLLRLTQDLGFPEGASFFTSAVSVVDEFVGEFEYVSNDADIFTFKTNHSAPKGKVVRVDVSDPEKLCRPDLWDTLVAEDPKDVLEWCSAVAGGSMVCCYLKDAKHVLEHRSLVTGEQLRTLDELPVASCAGFSCSRDQDVAFAKLTGFTSPGSIYRLDFSTSDGHPRCEATLFKETALELPEGAPEVETKQIFATNSKDGTRVPMFVIGADGSLAGSNADGPALLYGYGGFNISLTPSFSPARLAYVLGFGGVMAIANCRGGGEYGEEWHKAGTKLSKQNVFDDFQSCGEHLVNEGFCHADKLAIEGGSNGGLLVGACLNQRPDLFACGVAHVGVMDMLKFHKVRERERERERSWTDARLRPPANKFTIGHAWCTDFGNPEESDEMLAYLAAYSPLHNIPDLSEARYPSTMVLTGDHDDRVVPLHSLKVREREREREIVD